VTRLVAGRAGGRTLVVPRGATRPTSERVREALFSRLEHEGLCDGTRVLDLYAGSGALGLEAASRGAAVVVLVDAGREAARACRRNADGTGLADALGADGLVVVEQPVERVVAATPGGTTAALAPGADLVLVDPPYDLAEDALARVLGDLVAHGWLAPGAVVVVERARRTPEPTWPARLERYAEKRYGDTVLWSAELVDDPPVEAGPAAGG